MVPIVLAVTGASAQVLAERSLGLLLKANHNIHLVLSKGAYKVWSSELGIDVPIAPAKQEIFWRTRLNIESGELHCHRWNDNSANIASGSFITSGMVIVPCTMGTVGRISSGFSLNLIERCADVHLKEKRTLIISPRETPFSLIHLNNLIKLAQAGAIISPPIPAWYANPKSLDEMIDFIVVRLLDTLVENISPINRWSGPIK